MSGEYQAPNIDWDRVKRIIPVLQKWMKEHNYEKIDIQRAIAYLDSPHEVPRSGESPT